MGFVIALLTLVMVVDCLVLVLLVLIQLPKKDAGAGLAFGGAATDALFGAGSGNVLTKITKYAATGFFVMAVGLSLLQSNYHRRTITRFEQKLQQSGPGPGATLPPSTAPAAAPSSKPAIPLTSTNLSTAPAEATGTPAPVTNSGAAQ
jgi:preprotein translocase subunit SecG